jgi:hypothetical protein
VALEKTDASQVMTFAPDGVSSPRLLGQLGSISGLQYGWAWPGGGSSMTCNLLREPGPIFDAIKLGRIVKIMRGGGVLWEGSMQSPVPSSSGWTLTAQGNGTYGDNYSAIYTTWDQNDAVNQAISRGLRWANPGIAATGLYLGQQEDSGSQQITAFMSNLVTYGAYTWGVDQYGNLSVYPLPVPPFTPDRIIVAQAPAARTITADVNTVWLNYQVTADPTTTTDSSGTDTTSSTTAATNALTSVSNTADQAEHGTFEQYADLSSATTIATAGAAQAIGNSLLSQYQMANYSQPFTVMPGQLLTMGGVPVDLGTEKDQHVYQVWIFDGSYGGEIIPGLPCFVGGAVTFNDDTQSLQITPFQSVAADFSSLVTAVVDQNTPPPTTTTS